MSFPDRRPFPLGWLQVKRLVAVVERFCEAPLLLVEVSSSTVLVT